MRGVILQPSFIPWIGYFHLIQKCDVFVFLDDVQYTTRDWRNRNIILLNGNQSWLTIPVKLLNGKNTKINHVITDDTQDWRTSCKTKLIQAFSKRPYFREFRNLVSEIIDFPSSDLVNIVTNSVEKLRKIICTNNPKFLLSSQIMCTQAKSEKILQICIKLGITHYISGIKAKTYLQLERFKQNGISVEFVDYSYLSAFPSEEVNLHVSALDLLFTFGLNTRKFL